ncbi:MAG: hypothetical protein ACERKZ_04125 [Lachnotalea sp.]
MNKIIKKLKEIIFKEYQLIILFILFFIIHLTYTRHTDDYTVIMTHKNMSLSEEIDYVKKIANGWTSRLLINPLIHGMAHLRIRVWVVLDTLMITFIAKFIMDLFEGYNYKKMRWFVFALVLLFPFQYMVSAGWMVTTMTYIWPMAVGLYYVRFLKRFFCKKIKLHEYILSTLALLYAANLEQISVVLLGVTTFTLIYAGYKKRKWSIICFYQILSLGSFLFHVISPGNASRERSEIATWFLDYEQLSLVKKIELGFSSSLNEFVFNYNVVFLIVVTLLAVLVWYNYSETLYRVISAIPFVAVMVWGPAKPLLVEKYSGINQISKAMTTYGFINVENYMSYKSYIPIIILAIISSCILVSIYLIYGNNIKSIICIGIFGLGLASRMVLAFSPTIWASSLRTFSIFYIILIIIASILIESYLNIKNKYLLKGFAYLIGIYASINYINLMITMFQA